MSYQPWYKLFCILIVTTSPENETLIPKIVGFHLTKILQSEEFHLITFNLRKIRFSIQIQIPQIVGIRGIKNIQSGEFLLITFNLRNFRFSIQIQIPQIVGIQGIKNIQSGEVGIFY